MHTRLRCIFRSLAPAVSCMVLAGAAAAPAAHGQGPQAIRGALRLESPDRRNTLLVEVREGNLFYMVQRDGRTIILPSRLGFEFRGARALRDSLRLVSNARNTVDNTWTQPWGEVEIGRASCRERGEE